MSHYVLAGEITSPRNYCIYIATILVNKSLTLEWPIWATFSYWPLGANENTKLMPWI